MDYLQFAPEGCTGSTGEPTDMFYRSFLYDAEGAHFQLLKENHHTKADIERAKKWLRRNRDVVSIKLISETE
jgi:hypothetical protein